MACYRPDCSKMECRNISDIILYLPTFGPVYFCAEHGLRNIKLAPEGILGDKYAMR